MGLSLPGISRKLRTEGWIAGLQPAALALQGHRGRSAGRTASEFIQDFTGSHRYIASYLVEEVLNQQPGSTLDFLLQTSILDRLSGPLCDAVTRIIDSQAILEKLEQANLFIMPLDDEGRWFRYHQLFAEVLHVHLHQLHGDLIPKLHRRAADWYARNGFTTEAIRHAFAANDNDLAARLIEQNGLSMLAKGQVHAVLGW
jgi:LuxR family maltose regulon positive regulatory protein